MIVTVSAAVNAKADDNFVSVEPNRDQSEVTERDKTGALRPSNFALVSQVKKKEAP